MRIFGRYMQAYKVPGKILQLIPVIAQIFLLCKSPFRVVYSYFFKKNISPFIQLRSGLIIYLSGNEKDIITFVTIFCKKEYGEIDSDGLVIDIGANIGLFTLYAALHGVSKIISVEPNMACFKILQKNILGNNLQNVVAIHKAVSSKTGEHLFVPQDSNPDNICYKEAEITNKNFYTEVETVSLPDLLKQQNIEKAGLIKMDCEGAEYDILLPLTVQEMCPIQTIKMEYHAESWSLINHFLKNGFKITRLKSTINSSLKAGKLEAARL